MNAENEVKSYANQGMALLVEGKDEIGFFTAILNKLNVATATVWFADVGGKDQFPNKFPAAIKSPGFKEYCRAYAIIRDADTNASSTFDSVKSLLTRNGQPVPSGPGKFTTGTPKVGVYIMPGNADSGMLESLCMQSVADHPTIPCVETFMKCTEAIIGPPENPHKARASCFIAGNFKKYASVGIGAKAGLWNFDHSCMADLKTFLKELQP